MSKKTSIIKRFFPYMGNKKYLLPLALFLSAISSVLALLPFVFIYLIAKTFFASDQNINLVNFDQVKLYAWLALAAVFLSMLLYFLALAASHLAAFRVEVGMRKAAMQRIINMPLGFFDNNQSGKLRKIIDDNSSQTHTFLAHQLPDLSSTIVAPLTLFVLIFVVDWRMGLVMLIPIVLGIVSMSFMMSKNGEKFRSQYLNSLEEMSSEAVEYVRGIPVVKTFGQSVFAYKRFIDSITRYRDMVTAFTLMWKRPMSFYTVIMQSAAFFLVPFAIFFINDQNMGLVLSNFLFYLIIAPSFTLLFMRSMNFRHSASMAVQVIDRFDAVLDYPDMVFAPTAKKPEFYDIEFSNVYFAYQGTDKNAVDGVSFQVKTGETVALVGTSGSGKTTIARLAARFWDVQEGEILIGGKNINQLTKKDLMHSIAFVFQNTKLFKMSLRDNIRYGNPNASEEAIQQAIDLSQSRDIINQLPGGLDTVIGTEGTYLSGGEQQRIVLARAILKDAPIVLLDEATAFADPENESLIQQALRELSKNKTTLMIAHRLSTVKKADKILVIEQGKIVESGTHDELLEASGRYLDMWSDYKKSVNWNLRGAK